MTVGSQVKQCLSSIKSIEASLSSLALRTQDTKAKQTFHETMLVMDEILNDLKIRVGEIEREEYQYKGF
ncbi:DUF1657 domain-containing protein [Bacillus sp. REN16]|uniref:DUF1657 domain-containing protein n=1 Tax=Bacillus sp. REN16 TaxID=2887296 RepID=UPI001E5ADF96|nr:DUF1657 domain-containing protein [Bacillus sp. REN16]MCC3355937.1 DUF1657 domain-containing protein [Bacillus sp. REN16]